MVACSFPYSEAIGAERPWSRFGSPITITSTPNETVAIVNYLHNQANEKQTIFFDIYTDAEKAADPRKQDTGLFFFRGNRGSRFAICNAGGAFAFVGNSPRRATTLLPLSTDRAHGLHVTTWREPSASSLPMPTIWA